MVEIVLGSSLAPLDESVARLVTSGRGSLAFILGNDASRYRLLGQAINWDRVLLAMDEGQAKGYAAFKHKCRGPFRLRAGPFVTEFGVLRGLWRFSLFAVSELRECRYPFLLYGLRVLKTARKQGLGSALVNACCQHASNTGFAQVDLEVPINNANARQLYAHNGFVVQPVMPVAPLFRLLPPPPMLGMQRLLKEPQ